MDTDVLTKAEERHFLNSKEFPEVISLENKLAAVQERISNLAEQEVELLEQKQLDEDAFNEAERNELARGGSEEETQKAKAALEKNKIELKKNAAEMYFAEQEEAELQAALDAESINARRITQRNLRAQFEREVAEPLLKALNKIEEIAAKHLELYHLAHSQFSGEGPLEPGTQRVAAIPSPYLQYDVWILQSLINRWLDFQYSGKWEI